MKPDVDRLLEVAALHLVSGSAPELGSGYAQASLMVFAVLLGAVREEFERAAARRVEENRALRTLFGRAAAGVGDDRLRARLEEAAASQEGELRISELERENGRLRGLLIELHAHVEEREGDDARRIEEEIWAELVASTERRRLSLGAY